MNKGFTLIELAIVLVIIGLLVAGVLAGQELIMSTRRANTIKRSQELDRAVQTFKLKYNGIPGDITNATLFWPTETNSDGNGQICCWAGQEYVSFWTQLKAANLYSYTTGGNSYNVVIDNSQYVFSLISYVYPLGINQAYGFTNTLMPGISNIAKHAIYYWGNKNADANGAYSESGYAADYMALIDAKVDDGKPLTGMIRSTNPGDTDLGILCRSGSAYITDDSSAKCITMWYLSF